VAARADEPRAALRSSSPTDREERDDMPRITRLARVLVPLLFFFRHRDGDGDGVMVVQAQEG